MVTKLLDARRFQSDFCGKPTALYTLQNASGLSCSITNLGAKILQLLAPDRDGQLDDVVLGYDSLAGVVDGSPSMGAFIGRYAGRIGGSAFALNGHAYRLTANNGLNCLHGGILGSRFRVFDAVQHDATRIDMRYLFEDGEEGFPGQLVLDLTYSLTDDNELLLEYTATAFDKPTVASFTTHAFFNLNGHASGSLADHEVTLYADQRFAMRDDLVATGELLNVADTPFDFRQPQLLAPSARSAHDSCYLLNKSAGNSMSLAAQVRAHESGRTLQVWSTEPALQFYTGLQPNEALAGGLGKGGATYLQQQSVCLEPQGYPNAPNLMQHYPPEASAVYMPGIGRSGRTAYRFGIQ